MNFSKNGIKIAYFSLKYAIHRKMGIYSFSGRHN